MSRRDCAAATRSEYEDCACMIFDEAGNAFHCIDYTPEALEAEALRLRKLFGEATTVTYGPSPFIAGGSNERR